MVIVQHQNEVNTCRTAMYNKHTALMTGKNELKHDQHHHNADNWREWLAQKLHATLNKHLPEGAQNERLSETRIYKCAQYL